MRCPPVLPRLPWSAQGQPVDSGARHDVAAPHQRVADATHRQLPSRTTPGRESRLTRARTRRPPRPMWTGWPSSSGPTRGPDCGSVRPVPHRTGDPAGRPDRPPTVKGEPGGRRPRHQRRPRPAAPGHRPTRDPDAVPPGRRDPRGRAGPGDRGLPGPPGGPPGPVRRHPLAVQRRSGLVPGRCAAPRRGRCAYCGGSAGTVDHVLPRSRGGRNTWRNTTAACYGCNQRKGDRTPAEAGMPLRQEPLTPSWASLAGR